MRHRLVESRVAARAAVAGLALGLAALAALSWWGATSTRRATAQVRSMNEVSAGWQQVYDRILGVDDALGDYQRAGSAAGRAPLISAISAAETAIRQLQATGDPADAAAMTDIGDVFDGYAGTLRELYDADQRGDRVDRTVLVEQASLASAALHKQVGAGMEQRRLATVALLDDVDGDVRQLRSVGTIVFGIDSVLLVVCALVVLGYQRRVEGQASTNQHQALHDALTGLANRTLLAERTAAAVGPSGGTAALLLIDLDRFKEVNDTLGHPAGDILLREVSARLSRATRDGDTVARLGGDEFAVLIPGASPAIARDIAERVVVLVREPVEIEGISVAVGASIGLAVCPDDSADASTLLQHADIAMYAAKREQLGLVQYDAALNEHSRRQLKLLGELREAIGRDELVLHYQPKVRGAAAELAGVEALVRWQHPEHGLLPPGEFVPLAEESDAMEPMTWRVLQLAAEQCRRWLDDGRRVPVAVNIATRCLYNPAFGAELDALLARCGLPAELLTLEVTETTLISDPPQMARVLGGLRALGVRLSLDDFGTGYSSMSYLRDLPLDELKIDRRFIANLRTARGDLAIVHAVTELGSNLGLAVVAEGVEDAETWTQLVGLGCGYGQGYHFARPMPAEAFDEWLTARCPVEVTPA